MVSPPALSPGCTLTSEPEITQTSKCRAKLQRLCKEPSQFRCKADLRIPRLFTKMNVKPYRHPMLTSACKCNHGETGQEDHPILGTWNRADERCLPGWDVFILKYDVEEPVATVLDEPAMKAYLRMFRLLWALKRAEHSLNDCWVDLNSVQRQLTAFPTYIKRSGANAYSASLPLHPACGTGGWCCTVASDSHSGHLDS